MAKIAKKAVAVQGAEPIVTTQSSCYSPASEDVDPPLNAQSVPKDIPSMGVDRVCTDRFAVGPDPHPNIPDQIGHQLRRVYSRMLAEPLPSKFTDLIEQLAKLERKS